MAKKKAASMTRDDARELYRDLQNAMGKIRAEKEPPVAANNAAGVDPKAIAKMISEAMKKDDASSRSRSRAPSGAKRSAGIGERHQQRVRDQESSGPGRSDTPTGLGGSVSSAPVQRVGRGGRQAAVLFLVLFALCNVLMSGLQASGVMTVHEVQATANISRAPSQRFSREEIQLLQQLDQRRAQLEERRRQLDKQAQDYAHKDREFTVKLTELRELSERLRLQRERGDQRKKAQLDQLANVYGSMNPAEAAQLMDQLDVTIALALLQRMPEKRIGQILSLMTPQRALSITQMLSE